MTMKHSVREALIYSISSFPRRREPRKIKSLDPRLRGDDDLISASLERQVAAVNHFSQDKTGVHAGDPLNAGDLVEQQVLISIHVLDDNF